MQRDIDHAKGQDEADSPQIVPHLRFLRLLVAGMAVAMVLGLAAIVAILWIRLSAPPLPELPAAIALPEGASAEAVTFSARHLIVVTDTGEVLVYGRDGSLQQRVALDQP